jgi:hypothetical protein
MKFRDEHPDDRETDSVGAAKSAMVSLPAELRR